MEPTTDVRVIDVISECLLELRDLLITVPYGDIELSDEEIDSRCSDAMVAILDSITRVFEPGPFNPSTSVAVMERGTAECEFMRRLAMLPYHDVDSDSGTDGGSSSSSSSDSGSGNGDTAASATVESPPRAKAKTNWYVSSAMMVVERYTMTTIVVRQRNRADYRCPHEWFPKGKYEARDVNALECAVREMREETGINLYDARYANDLKHTTQITLTDIASRRATILNIMFVDEVPSPNIDAITSRDEIAEVIVVPLERMLRLTDPQRVTAAHSTFHTLFTHLYGAHYEDSAPAQPRRFSVYRQPCAGSVTGATSQQVAQPPCQALTASTSQQPPPPSDVAAVAAGMHRNVGINGDGPAVVAMSDEQAPLVKKNDRDAAGTSLCSRLCCKP